MSANFVSQGITIPSELPEILKDLNREILRHQPKDINLFCANYFQRKVQERQMEGGNKKNSMSPADLATVAVNSSDHSDLEGSGSDEEVSAPPPKFNRERRTSVSAESMVPTADDKEWVKVNIPKTDEQRKRIQESVSQNFLFRHLDEEQYNDVVNAMAEKKISAAEEVIKQGGIGDYFYVVETGTLDVLVARNGNPPTKVTDYGPGGSFGELALMYNAPRAATVVATSDCVLWALDRVTFRRILMENTSRKRRMYEAFLEEVPLFHSLEPYERHKIADALESVTFNDGEVVIKQGAVGESFYIIESGDATVTQSDAAGKVHELPSLTKGDYFGELALLTDKPRVATITAKGKLKVATMNKRAFVRLLGPVVDILKRNATNYKTIMSSTLKDKTKETF